MEVRLAMPETNVRPHEVDVCIVGGGPAGLLLALLLVARGIKALVLERHPDFERDLRGEILQPRFTQLMRQVHLFDYLVGFPHEKIARADFVIDGRVVGHVDYARVAPDVPFMIWMRQPTMLSALHRKGLESPQFDLWFHANVVELLKDDERVVGALVETADGPVAVRAKVVVGADGRASTIRKLMGAEIEYERHNVDVLWFLLDRPAGYTQTCNLFVAGDHSYLILPKHPNQLQCGMLFRAGSFPAQKKRGIEELKQTLARAHPVFAEFVRTVVDFTPFTLLQGKASFVKNWAADGCLLIGDAAHTCSPAGGIGVSVAMATAIVAADTLCQALPNGDVSQAALSQVQQRRSSEIRQIHRAQHGFTSVFVTYVSITRRLGPWILPALTRLGFLAASARKLLTQPPLPTELPLSVP